MNKEVINMLAGAVKEEEVRRFTATLTRFQSAHEGIRYALAEFLLNRMDNASKALDREGAR